MEAKKPEAKETYTHWVSVPLNALEYVEKFKLIQESVKTKVGAEGYKKYLYCQPPDRIHVTLGYLRLPTESLKQKATQVAEKLKEELSATYDKSSIKLDIGGISWFNKEKTKSEPAKVQGVYFLDILPNPDLNKLCSIVFGAFVREKVVTESDLKKDHMILTPTGWKTDFHLTLFKSSGRPKTSAEKALSLQVHQELQAFAETAPGFGPATTNRLEVSIRGEYAPSGFYKALAVIPLQERLRSQEEEKLKN